MNTVTRNEIADRYRRRADDFDKKVAAVQPDQWSNPSPCEDWTARDVVDHIVDMHASGLRPLRRRLSPAPSVAQDPLAAYRSARADVLAVLDDPDLAEAIVDTPSGHVPAAQYIDTVLSADIPLHGWDLAKATGQDDTIDPHDVEEIWATLTALPNELLTAFRTPGVLGPEVKVPDDAPLQDRLLGLLGRDPDSA